MNDLVEKFDPTQPETRIAAPGAPGKRPHWSSGAKTAVGTAVSSQSHIWFTISSGTINEIYYPDVDKANTRSVRFIVTDGDGYFCDEETDATHSVSPAEDGVPLYTVNTTGKEQRFRLTKEIFSDPVYHCLLMRVRMEGPAGLRLYLRVDPQLADQGKDNCAWIGAWKGQPMLVAGHRETAMAVAATASFGETTCGFIGRSDGLRDLRKHGRLTKRYNHAERGNVAMLAAMDWQACGGEFVVAIGMGEAPAQAAHHAQAGLMQVFDDVRSLFLAQWREAHRNSEPDANAAGRLFRTSTAVLRTHASKAFPVGSVASLSIPWGFARGDKDVGGYHVVWPRDMVQIAMGRIACGDAEGGREALFYLACTQEKDGSWPQNMWLDGTPNWRAEQMDAIALPVLLADMLRRKNELEGFDPWPMVLRAASFLVRNGPATEQDRWEAIAGYSPFTMACEVAALLAAADFADRAAEPAAAAFLRETADAWNEAIDELTCFSGTRLAVQFGVERYYIRAAPPEAIQHRAPDRLRVTLPNHALGMRTHLACDVISPDALALVRFGLRAADDPGIAGTVRLIDALLRRETATGPGWRRSSFDGYGEHEDGSPYNGRGVGRCWPLLAGERAHYELAAGNADAARSLLGTMEAQANECGMIPEQVWDAADIPEKMLWNGRANGSGMPLAWAHAEYIKLSRSLERNGIWDMPPQTVQRYLVEKRTCAFQIWTEREPREWVRAGRMLRMDFSDPAEVRWALDGKVSADAQSAATKPAGLPGVHTVLLPLPVQEPWRVLHVEITQGDRVQRVKIRSRG